MFYEKHMTELLQSHGLEVEVVEGAEIFQQLGAFLNFGGTNIYNPTQIENSRAFTEGRVKTEILFFQMLGILVLLMLSTWQSYLV